MSLFLTNSKDHALLALVIRYAHEAVREDGFVGRTALQKIMYFLKVLGVPMKYDFDLYHYGPFCAMILRDVDWLVADKVIKDESGDPHRYSNYTPDEGYEELYQKHKGEIESHMESIRIVAEAFAPMRPEQLELLATLDYLYRKLKASGDEEPYKVKVLDQLEKAKPGKFTVEAPKIYDLMVKIGLLEK